MRKIGRFNIRRKLGSGSQGTVYLCSDPELQRQVAIKVLDRPLGGAGEVQAFIQEARTISRIQHPNIVSIFDVVREAGRPYLVFEYVEGELLSERLGKGVLPLPQALDIATGIFSGVDQVHRKGIVHRDLKPSNIILGEQDVPKIMDFGIARIVSPKGSVDRVLTGTPRYMAPEYIGEGRVSPQADVFALGAILFELLTGEWVFDAGSREALLEQIQRLPARPPSRVNQQLGDRLDALVLKALEKRPEARFASAGEMLTALLDYREAADAESGESGTTKGTIAFLLRRMQHKSDFPALSESIRTLNRLASSEDEDISRLASVIIRDFALANKILKVVNSAYYSRFAGKIGTISRAIVVLGVRTIRSIAASLIFFEHLHNKSQASRLKNEIASAIFSATLARQAAESAGMEHVEESFLCGMLHNLGQILVTYYLDDESQEISRLVNQEGVGQEQAEKSVLGMTFQQVGIAIAEQWNFPGTITRGMKKVDPAAPGNLNDSDVKLRLIANFSNQATRLIGEGGEQQEHAVKELLNRYRTGLAISGKRFEKMVTLARQEFGELSGSLGSKSKTGEFVQRLLHSPQTELDGQAPATSGGAEDITETLALQPLDRQDGSTGVEEATAEDQPINAEAVLAEGLQEVTSILLEEEGNISQIFNVVLETVYRALAFGRVVLCLQSVGSKQVAAKLGFGNDIETFMAGFHFGIQYQPNVFHAALKNGVDLYIADTRDQKISSDIPDWYKKISNAGSFFIFPLIVNNKPLGLIYADHPKPDGVSLSSRQLNLIKSLRNQIILGFKARM